MYNQPSYQVAYANFVMDQDQDIQTISQNTSPLLQTNSILQPQLNNMEFKKSVRTRISFSHQQQVILETEFQISAYIYKRRLLEIAARLGIDEKQVKVWFQNRRMKWKRETLQNENKKSFKKQPTKFAVPVELRGVQQENKRKEFLLPVHKPMAAQLVKGSSLNIPTDFKPQLIVQMPALATVPQRTQPTQQQQRQLEDQFADQPLPHKVLQQRPIRQELQQALDVQHKLQQHQPPQIPMLEVPHLNRTASTIVPRDTIIEGLQNSKCSEESVDLDRYLNDLERRVETLKWEEDQKQLQLQQTIMKIQEDLGVDGLSNSGMDLAALSPKMGDDFDVKDLLEDFDRYVSCLGTAPELNFDDSLFGQQIDFDNCPILKYDPTLPLVDFSFDEWALVKQ